MTKDPSTWPGQYGMPVHCNWCSNRPYPHYAAYWHLGHNVNCAPVAAPICQYHYDQQEDDRRLQAAFFDVYDAPRTT